MARKQLTQEDRIEAMIIGKRVESYRKIKGVSVLHLAGIIGMTSYQSYRSRELGNTKFTDEMLGRIATALDIDLENLLGIEDKNLKQYDKSFSGNPCQNIISNIEANLPSIRNVHILKSIESLVMSLIGREATMSYQNYNKSHNKQKN